MRSVYLAALCALLTACFSKPGFKGGGGDDGGIDAPTDGPPIDPTGPALIATGGGGGGTGGHACRITNGTLLCWGNNSNGQLGPRGDVNGYTGQPGAVPPSGWTSLATGILHTCGVRAGDVYCWGQNYYGQSAPGLSANTTIDVTRVVLPGTADVDRVFAGGFSTCAITTAGDAYCWGDINLQRTMAPSTAMRLGTPGTLFTQIALADDHGCAIASDGVVHCWGLAEEQQTGQGDEVFLMFAQAKPIVSAERFTSLSADHEATCGTTTNGALVCWGSSNHGQLGPTSSSSNGHAPLRIGLDSGWTGVAVGTRHTCGVRAGDVYCFGDDQYGALGNGTFSPGRALPTMKVRTEMTVSQIAASDGYTCALSTDGVTMKCWGSNAKGELGNKEFSRKLDPVEVTLGGSALQLVTGDNHTCALVGSTSPAPAYCWGNNGERQAGTTSSQPLYSAPVLVTGGYTFSQLAAGGLHTCGITNDDTVIACWGDNVSHQLGSTNGASMVTVSATAVGAGLRWRSVAAGSRMSCGITDTNRLFCWGLRAGTTVATGTPTEYLAPIGTWKSISIGSDFAVGVVDASGSPRMFSFADPMKLCAANLPPGQSSPQTPTQILSGLIPSSTTFPVVAAAQHNGAHTCILRTNGSTPTPIVTCFGESAGGRTAGTTTCNPPNSVDVALPATGAWLGPSATGPTLFTASDQSCALDMNGQLICWGQNSNFELGREYPDATPTVISAKPWLAIAGGFDHTCGIDTARKVFCWGENQHGQVGDGTSYEPSPVVSGVP